MNALLPVAWVYLLCSFAFTNLELPEPSHLSARLFAYR
jgi:hypothetical protein